MIHSQLTLTSLHLLNQLLMVDGGCLCLKKLMQNHTLIMK